jgi:pimeloyl-ACP methyl ester carboxylesterase
VRERARPATIARGRDLADRVVLFVHGAGTPAEVAFDVPFEDYSWMAYLAAAGYDVFSVDMTGYGRSTRPTIMNDPCNLSEDSQMALGNGTPDSVCVASHVGAATTIESDWHDIDQAVDFIRNLRAVERVHLVGWSLGGPRAGGYTARNSDKVSKLILLAPAYDREAPSGRPSEPDQRAVMSSQSRTDFMETWNRPQDSPNQRDAAAGEVIFSEMLASDPVGASWGEGIRRAPNVVNWGWNADVVARQKTPLLAIAAANDQAIPVERVQALYDDYGGDSKILIDLGCASHSPMWESVHGQMFEASLEFLRAGTVSGQAGGIVRMGY